MVSTIAHTEETDVLIVGAGPVGLTLANSLAQYGIRCTLIERNKDIGILPKMDLSNPRSMEIFGRLGLADKIRDAGWPLDARFDVKVGYSLLDEPYHVLDYPSILEMQADIAACTDGTAPREPYERISQYNLERLLKDELEAQPTARVRFGNELVGFEDDGTVVTATVKAHDGCMHSIQARYLVGCDGGNSKVRMTLGVEYEGKAAVARNFMVFFRCPELLERTGLAPFRHFYIAGARNATLVAQDDLKRWSLHVQIGFDVDASKLDPVTEIREALGIDLPVEVLYAGAWTPHLLVASQYRRGRVFMAGDAVHQYIPTGGFGMNTGVSEADNLAWKLAAVLKGWGGEGLLDSYEIERLPVAQRNCRASGYAAEGVRQWRSLYDPIVMESSEEGRQRRAVLVSAIDEFQRRSHEQSGIERAYRYTNSPVILHEPEGSGPDPDQPYYVPSAVPGTRLPHYWLESGLSVHDRLGRGLTLLCLDGAAQDIACFRQEAQSLQIPLDIVEIQGRADMRQAYGANLLLLRPDVHVAWRGDAVDGPGTARNILSVATGRTA